MYSARYNVGPGDNWISRAATFACVGIFAYVSLILATFVAAVAFAAYVISHTHIQWH